MAAIDAYKYSHSPIHTAVLARDHAALQRELSSLSRLSDPSEICTEASSISEEEKADAISAVIDRRDVPNRETPLHLAVRLSDPTAVEMLMAAGAESSLRNQQGWNALEEAICMREEELARIIVRYYQPLAYAKWYRRLPRVIGTMRRMRDFYMEITFHFESSVIPFISKVAPSDTYKIWKRGPDLRADMTLAGFDGFRIQRADQSILLLGEGSKDYKVPPGSLCVVSHKNKEVMNALEGGGAQNSEEEIQHEVSAMSKTEILRPGIDMTKAVLLPQMTWRRQERRDTVGPWKAKVYDMHHVVVSLKTRQVPGASTKHEFSSCNEDDNTSKEYGDILTEEERKQLDAALKMECPDMIDEGLADGYVGPRHSCYEQRGISIVDASCCGNNEVIQGKGKAGHSHDQDGEKKIAPSRRSLCVGERASDLLGDSPYRFQSRPGRPLVDDAGKGEDVKGTGDMDSKDSAASSEIRNRQKPYCRENDFRKGLRPSLWLSPNFPLQTEELLPLLDILANKVKAIRRLRELLTTKLPPGTFPVKVAIPLVPTIKVLVTFTKFEELHPSEEFSTPPLSPQKKPLTSSWRHWLTGPYRRNHPPMSGPSSSVADTQDPFMIPPDYTWITPEAKNKRMREKKGKSNKGRGQNK